MVYHWKIADLVDLRKAIRTSSNLKSTNQFAQWIVQTKDTETIDFLELAKNCEKIRAQHNTLWYYPVDGDDYSNDLEKVIRQASAYRGERLRDRYGLQIIRALFALQQYGECLNFWTNHQNDFTIGVIKEMAVDYIAGSYVRLKQTDKAKELYASQGDPNAAALWGLCKTDRFEAVYRSNPNHPWLIIELQRQIHQLESWEGDGWYSQDVSTYSRKLYNKVVRICQDNLCSDMSPWFYARAFLAEKLEKMNEAMTYIVKAENTVQSSDMRDAIRIFKLLLTTRRTKHYNGAFENHLYHELKWLDWKVKTCMNKETLDQIEYSGIYHHINGESQYYWSDMLRKILIGYVVPLCLESDQQVRALEYLNFADNQLFISTDSRLPYYEYKEDPNEESGYKEIQKKRTWDQYRLSDSNENSYDYSTDFFVNLDSIGVQYIQQMVVKLQHPQCALDTFLANRSYVDLQYFDDIIGTQLIAAMKYKEAIPYLEQVSAQFNRSRNVFVYCQYDPFTLKEMEEPDEFFKLKFARKMYSLENEIAQAADVNVKAQLMLTFAQGLQSSIDRRGWPLTTYYRGEFYVYDYYSDYQVKMTDAIEKRSLAMIQEALSMFTDRELAAQAHYDWKRYKTAVTNFPETDVAKYIQGHCDQLRDYVVRPRW